MLIISVVWDIGQVVTRKRILITPSDRRFLSFNSTIFFIKKIEIKICIKICYTISVKIYVTTFQLKYINLHNAEYVCYISEMCKSAPNSFPNIGLSQMCQGCDFYIEILRTLLVPCPPKYLSCISTDPIVLGPSNKM